MLVTIILSDLHAQEVRVENKQKYNAIELSGGYGIALLLDDELQDSYTFIYGFRFSGMLRVAQPFSIGVYYSVGSAVENLYAPNYDAVKFSKLVAELRLRLVTGFWVYGRYGKFELENFLYTQGKISTNFSEVGMRFDTSKEKLISAFFDAGYVMSEFDEIEYPMNQVNLSIGLCLNF